MRSKIIVLGVVAVVILAVALLAVWIVPGFAAAGKYDEARQKYERELGPPYALREMDAAMLDKLREIETKWSRSSREVGGAYAQAMRSAGMNPTVANLVQLINHRMPAYSWTSPARNKASLAVAVVQATIVPTCVDRSIHVSADKSLAVIVHSEGAASIFRETEKGLEETLWAKSGPKQDAPVDGNGSGR